MGTMSFPSGKSDIGISLKFAKPSGIPMMVMHNRAPVTAWPMASQTPDKMNQMIFPIPEPTPAPDFLTHRSPERPERKHADAKRCDAERDPDDGDAPENAKDDVGEEHPEPGQDQPQQVEHESHVQNPARSLRVRPP